MLYGNNNIDVTQLTEVLKIIGVLDSTVDIGIRYMGSDTADETLLDGISPVKFNDQLTWENRRKLNEFINKLILPNDELCMRFVNLIFASASISGAPIIFSGTYRKGGDEDIKFRVNALKRRFPDEAKAIELALRASFYNEMWWRGGYLPADDAEMYVKAMEMLDKYDTSDPHYITKTALCTFALSSTPLPSKEPSVTDSAVVKTCCETMLDIYEHAGQFSAEQYTFVAVGMGEAAPFSEKAKEIFKSMAEKNLLAIVQSSRNMQTQRKRVMNVIESIPEIINADYVHFLAEGHFTNAKERLGNIVKYDTKLVRTALDSETDLKAAILIQDALAENDPDFDVKEYDLKGRVQRRASRVLEAYSKDNSELIRNYLSGKGSYDDISFFKGYHRLNNLSGGSNKLEYYNVFGADDFFKRIFTITMIASDESYYVRGNAVDNTGFNPYSDFTESSIKFMLDAGAPLTDAISCMGIAADGAYGENVEKCTCTAAKTAAKYPELLAECEPKKMSVRGRIIYTRAVSEDTERFRKQLSALADDGSKVVRAEVISVFKAHKELADEIKTLLTAKKQAKRDIAVSVIEAWGTAGFTDELQKALDSEKNDKLKVRIAALIGSESAAAAVKVDSNEVIKKLMRSASKLAWLYSKPFEPVHKTDGAIADEDYLKVLMLCYVSMDKLGRNNFACELAEALDKKDLELFAQEVFNRWYEKGAETKTKWVLYFSAIYGGSAMFHELVEHIYEWGDYAAHSQLVNKLYNQNNFSFPAMRTGIAGDAVRAIAMNGSSEALMIVDNISRKFKGKSVRTSAVNAMASAADNLGITAEELADRIVPDLGFDENLCRVFDYGKRQFNVYIRPSLELEIFNGDKKIKSMPKPGATDDAEKANAAYEQFKEMKKVMKTAVTVQKQRLEYVLMCDRKWSADGWRTLFVKNAIMHCFAIGLIWGIYEDGKLSSTFRYMDDGSFTTSDGDEFELPENAVIGLVHPIELSEELKAQWTEQLSDYEIVQPFPQLSRPVFAPDASELEMKRITRFKGCECGSLSLVGKMTRFGWYKGQAEDAGFFYYFTREDVSSRSVAPDGSPLLTGCGAMMIHSGMYIAAYDMEEESVNAEDIVFFKAGSAPDYWDKEDKCFIKCSEVPLRYFSEIMMQLTSVFGSKEEG